MKKILITSSEFFEESSLRNPIQTHDHGMELLYPEFYCLDYDTKLLASNPPTKEEKSFWAYNDYLEQYGTTDWGTLDSAIHSSGGRSVFLNGFDQALFEYIAPQIKDTAQILYFFKCPRISDLSMLACFSKLQCVHIFHNNTLTKLWDMSQNHHLKVISFCYATKLQSIETLLHSPVEYVYMDCIDNCGNNRRALFDPSIFDQMPHIKHLSLNFSNCKIEKTW